MVFPAVSFTWKHSLTSSPKNVVDCSGEDDHFEYFFKFLAVGSMK